LNGRDWNMAPALMSVHEFAAFAGIGIAAAYRLTKIKGFPALPLTSRRILVDRDGFRAWVQKHYDKVS
jgi:hypothetical protein